MKKRKQRRKWCFFLFGTGKKTQILENVEEKNPTGLTNFFPPDLGGKLGRKERKGSLTRKLHIYPLLGVLWEIAWLTRESNPCWLIVFFFSFLLCSYNAFSLFNCFGFFFFYIKKKKICFGFLFFEKNFLGSWTSYPLFILVF